MTDKPVNKYFTLLSLYLAQSIPMSFFSTVLPVIMRMQHYSLSSIGYIQLVKLPWILKFLWAPFIDRSAKGTTGYRRWIFGSELFYALVVFSMAGLHLQTDFSTIVVLMIIAFTASATQDIATDAFAVLILNKEQRSMGNSMQSAGSFLGTVTGSGVLLIIYYYFGWVYLLAGLAIFVLAALVPLYFYPVRKKKKATHKIPAVKLSDIYLFFKRPGMTGRVILLITYYAGIIGILTMVKPWLVDLGYDMKQIGLISGITGAAAGALMALAAGYFIRKAGRRTALYVFTFAGWIVTLLFLYLSGRIPSKGEVYAAVILLWSTYGMGTVIIYTISMDIVRPGREGTDFTIQIVLTHLSSLIIAVLSGKFAHSFTYRGLFLAESMISFLIILSLKYTYTTLPDYESLKNQYYNENT